MAADATLVKALQQLLFPGTAVEHTRLALRLRQIADTLIASDAEERRATVAEHGCEVAFTDAGKPTPTHNGVEAACNGALAGAEDTEKQPLDVEDRLQTCRPSRNLGKGKKQGGMCNLSYASSLLGTSSVSSVTKFADASRHFRMDAYRQHRVALEVYYLGWAYHGFASQSGLEATVEVPAWLLFNAATPALTRALGSAWVMGRHEQLCMKSGPCRASCLRRCGGRGS